LQDTNFSTGKKKIKYESTIFADVLEQTIKLFEKTTEVSSGVSFGLSRSSTMQSCKNSVSQTQERTVWLERKGV
jgi:hypothetical protein